MWQILLHLYIGGLICAIPVAYESDAKNWEAVLAVALWPLAWVKWFIDLGKM